MDGDERTTTEWEQSAVEKDCAALLSPFRAHMTKEESKETKGKGTNAGETDILSAALALRRSSTVSYLRSAWGDKDGLSRGFETLDASRPWICYWIAHALALLGALPAFDDGDAGGAGLGAGLGTAVVEELDDDASDSLETETETREGSEWRGMAHRMADFLGRCQCVSGFVGETPGGFAGGPGQLAHLAPTYAAVNALVTLGTEEALSVIDRPSLYRFLLSCRQPDGSFVMHEGGEVDVRGAYCAVSVARLCNLLTPELSSGVAEWVARCQTHEGGFGGDIGNEAHGGYTFCALACLCLLGRADLVDVGALHRWAVHRQMDSEGGFQGRTNKLVDTCYSWWQGGIFPLLDELLAPGDSGSSEQSTAMFRQDDLQLFILACGQDPRGGGLRDKPGKYRDFYHTCYALSGLSAAQHGNPRRQASPVVLGASTNLLERTDSLHNVVPDRVSRALAYFAGLAPVGEASR